MLKLIRKKGFIKKVLWVLAFVIIISFTFWGTMTRFDTGSDSRLDYAGKIFNRKISFSEFEDAYLQTRNRAILRYGDEFPKISHLLNLDMETWDWLILQHEVRRRHIHVNDTDVITYIQKLPFFQRDGKFDDLLYSDILRYYFQCKPRDFEEGIRATLAFDKLIEEETANITVPDQEAWDAYQKEKEKIRINYVLFPIDDYKKDIAYDDKEGQEYFAKYKTNFQMPVMINIEYLNLPAAEDIKPEDKEKFKAKMDAIYNELKTNNDLKAVGQKYGLDLQESGFFSQEQPNLKIGFSYELLKKAFELKSNEVSAPMETTQGYYILKLKERKEAHVPTYDEIKDKIKDALISVKAKEISKTKAAAALTTLKEKLTANPQADFTQTAQELGFTTAQTPFFGRGEYLPSLGVSKDFQEMAFKLDDKNKLGQDVVDTAKGFCIIDLAGKQPVSQEDYAKEKDQYKQKLLVDKRNEAFNDFMAILRIKANLQDNVSKLKAKKTA